MPIEITRQQVAEFLDCDVRSVTTYQNQEQDPLPVLQRGKRGTANVYDAVAIHKWALRKEIGLDGGKAYDLELERSRLTHHQANKTELEEKVLKGDLIPADEVLSRWEKMVSSFRAKMLSIPTKTSHLLINVGEFDEVESILKTHVYEALKELSNEGNR